MGLDTYARKEVTCNECGQGKVRKLPEDAAAAFEDAGIELCGGMFSSNGDGGSFRGKVYNGLVEAATGQSLYQEWIEPERVSQMFDDIHNARVDLENLEKFLAVCDKYGLGLQGWW